MSGPIQGGRVERLFPVLILVAVAARLLSIWLLPPLIDVYYYDTEAVKALLGGLDPYGFTYTGIPAWLVTPEAPNVFAYLPGVLFFLAPFGAAFDIRAGLVFADFVVALGLLLVGGPRAKAAALSFLLLPFTVLFSTSYPNNSLVAMAFFGLAVSFWLRGREGIAIVLLGAALASSQFLWILLPLLLRWALFSRRLRSVVASVAVGFGLVLPFLLWNWSAFIYDTVTFQFARAPRTILSPAAFGINVNPTLDGIMVTAFGVAVPLALRAALTLTAMALAAWGSRDLRSLLFNASWFMLLTMFVLPNVISWWYLELPFQTFLMWFASTRKSSALKAANA